MDMSFDLTHKPEPVFDIREWRSDAPKEGNSSSEAQFSAVPSDGVGPTATFPEFFMGPGYCPQPRFERLHPSSNLTAQTEEKHQHQVPLAHPADHDFNFSRKEVYHEDVGARVPACNHDSHSRRDLIEESDEEVGTRVRTTGRHHRNSPLLTQVDENEERNSDEKHRRESEIDNLKATILALESQQRQREYEEQERVRPILDELHAQIITLQEKMAQHWRDYQSRVTVSRRCVETKIADIDNKISTLEQKNLYDASLVAPIRRFPIEILSEVFMAAITVYGCSALRLMGVCRSWREILMTTSRIWATIKVQTWTRTDLVEFLLERSRRVALDVEIDTDSDSESCISDSRRPYAALAMVAETSKRWRNVTMRSFPKEADLINSGSFGTTVIFEGPMESLESFRITGRCEMNPTLSKLIDLARSRTNSQLKTLELSTCDALYRFARPPSSVFRYLRSFKVDLAEMKDPLDILLQFERLEDLHAHRLHLPLYSDITHIPLVHTLKRLFLKSTSVQWMQARRFPKLMDCTIIWPQFPEALLSRDPVDLPVCAQFTYDDHLLQPLTAFHLPSLDKLVVRNEAWNRPRGSLQLGFIWGPNVLMERVLRPRILHLDTQCYDQHLINALKMIPEVEELVLGLVRPDALGKKFLSSMLAKRGRDNSTNTRAIGYESISIPCSGPAWTASLCPKLKVMGLKYRRWLRDHETDEISPILRRIVETRAKSVTPLQSFKFWATKETTDEGAKELVHVHGIDDSVRH